MKPLVFLYDKDICEYDTTYDDDVYRIETARLDKRKISSDPDRSMTGCYAYSAVITSLYCDMVYNGTGEDNFT